MQYSQGVVARVFALRLEHGEPMPQTVEQFCLEQGVSAGMAVMVGGAEDAGRFVVGPHDGKALPPIPVVTALAGVHELAAVGTIFPDAAGKPVLHMHAAFGRGEEARAGCIRAGIVAWHILEVILIEITGLEATRMPDEATGFALLHCRP